MAQNEFDEKYGEDVEYAPAVLKDMRENLEDVNTIMNGLEWIRYRTMDGDDACNILIELGVGEVTKLVMEKWKGHGVVQGYGIMNLYRLTMYSSERRAKIVQMGLGKCVIDAMKDHGEILDLQTFGCWAISEFVKVESNIPVLIGQGLNEELIQEAKARSGAREAEPILKALQEYKKQGSATQPKSEPAAALTSAMASAGVSSSTSSSKPSKATKPLDQ